MDILEQIDLFLCESDAEFEKWKKIKFLKSFPATSKIMIYPLK